MSANTVAAKRTWLVDWNSPPLSWCVNSIGRQNKAVTTTLCFHEHATRHDGIASPSRIANTSTSTKAPPQAQTAGWVSKQKSNLAHVKEQGLASSRSVFTHQPPTRSCTTCYCKRQQATIKQHHPEHTHQRSTSLDPETSSASSVSPASDQQTKDLGSEGVAYAAALLLKLKGPTLPATLPMSHTNESTFNAGLCLARKRGHPYSRNDVDMNQAPLSATGVNFYISGPRPARLFPTPIHEFRKGKYATAGGESGFMTVFEYDVRGHTMMIDVDTSFVRFTSITQALGKNKVNFGRLVKTCPALDPHITKLKGGYLSIQGTWLPFDLAKELSRRIAWEIRDHLVPLFGYDFPSTCLRPDSEGFGQLAIGMSQKRARKRHNNGGPHQTSCYGPSLPISVVGGQAIEHVSAKNSAVQPCYGSSQPATFHYSKGYGLESRPWYGQDYLESNSLESMWNSAQAGGGSVGLQVPISTCGATASPCLAAIGANGGSPILSSPPSSNASSSSNQSYTAAGYGLMVPPTVPSHSVNSEAGANQAEGPTPIDGSRSYASLTAHGYATGYGDANASLSTWNDATHASTYVSSSPKPPPPAPHGSSSFQFDAWQQPTTSC